MSRLSRKNRTNTDCNIRNSGGITDLFDNTIKSIWRINDTEYDFILDKMTDTEMELFISEKPTFTQKRQMLRLVERLLDLPNYRQEKIKNILK
jgi:hypothetical protein